MSTCFLRLGSPLPKVSRLAQRPPEFGPRRFSLEMIELGGSFCGRSGLDRRLEFEPTRLGGVLGGFGLQRSGFGFQLLGFSLAHL